MKILDHRHPYLMLSIIHIAHFRAQQDAIQPGKEFEYPFVVPDAGTSWYHSHYNETVQIEKGMYGALISGRFIGKEAKLRERDYLFMPGMDFTYVSSISFRAEREFFRCLKECADKGVMICSICNGAFA